MKIVIFALLGLLSFVASIVLALALTGNLSRESLSGLMGKETASELGVAEEPTDPAGVLAQELKAKENSLKEWEERLKAQEQQLEAREESLAQLRAEIESLQQEMDQSLEEDTAQRQKRLETVAITLSSMKAKDAAQRLAGFPEDEVAEILALMDKPKERADILAAMDVDQATRVLRSLQGEE